MRTAGICVLLVTASACEAPRKLSQQELAEDMRSQADMPVCGGVKVQELSYEDVGQDYSILYRVDMTEDCMARWQQVLRKDPIYKCDENSCNRFVYERFKEEQADIDFISPRVATVKFGKI